MTLEQIKKEIAERNYADTEFGLGKEELDTAAKEFISFIDLPPETKKEFYFKIDQNDRKAELGYLNHKREKGNTDSKEYFHYHPMVDEAFGESVKKYSSVSSFFAAAQKIYNEAVFSLAEMLDEFEKEFPGIKKQFFPDDSYDHFFLRFLKYDNGGEGEFLAKAHYDNGSYTLAIAESAPGLRIGKSDKDLKEVFHKNKSALFMPAMDFWRITTPEFTPAWHDVVQKSQNAYNKDVARWAIVFFADISTIKRYTYEEAHTPIAYWPKWPRDPTA